MRRSLQHALPPMEVKPSHRASARSEESAPRLPERAIHMANARVGAAVREGIGDRPLKEFGHEGLISEVCSGVKVPEYLARIADNPEARRRFALSLLSHDDDVQVHTVVTIPAKAS